VNARFYAPDAVAPGDRVTLPGDESQHMTRVLRLAVGAAIRVFNGRGEEFDATLESTTREMATVLLGERRATAAEPRVEVTLTQAVLKGDKMDDVVRDAVMLGVAAIRPILTWRCETTIGALERAHRRERWHRIAVSSAKQCGRAVVPQIHEPLGFEHCLDATVSSEVPGLMLVEPGAADSALSLRGLPEHPPREVSLLVGPEGGWTDSEVARGGAVCRLLTIGERTLRADMAPVVAMAALFARWGEF
jgi:16S rRNA (uracil1498-N3)-methyltransferase